VNRAVILVVGAAAAPLVLSAGVAMAAAGAGVLNPSGCTPAAVTATGKTVGAASGQWDAAQVANARIIYATGVQEGLPLQAEIIALATAMQESHLINLSYGTSDSLGLFQQRPSMGWGTPGQVMNPVYAATQFYDALVKVPGWQALPLTAAAQDVQHSGYPSAYAKWQGPATTLAESFGGTTAVTLNCAGSDSTSMSGTGVSDSGTINLPSWYHLPAGTSRQVAIAIAYALEQLGKPYIWGGTGPAGYDCSGLVMMAYQAAGISIPRTTYQQVDAGTAVPSFSDLLPGDLLLEAGSDGTAWDPGHVGMYIGDGLVIQAPYTGVPINLTPASEWQGSTVDIRRIVN
jgi:cell wall-associated NlpC family hydrolase